MYHLKLYQIFGVPLVRYLCCRPSDAFSQIFSTLTSGPAVDENTKTCPCHQSVCTQQRLDLCRHRTTSLEQSQTMWAVIRPVQAVTEDIIIRTARARRSLNCLLTAPNRNILSYLLTTVFAISFEN